MNTTDGDISGNREPVATSDGATPGEGGYNIDGDAPRRQSPPGEPTASSAADVLGPRLTLATQNEGYAAGFAGEHVRSCPWISATTGQEQALRLMWIRGYAAGRTDLRRARTPHR